MSLEFGIQVQYQSNNNANVCDACNLHSLNRTIELKLKLKMLIKTFVDLKNG